MKTATKAELKNDIIRYRATLEQIAEYCHGLASNLAKEALGK